ncbi:MAG: pitrilysin family protein [Oenococcus sp.]|uniref:EF-P 5-aminopentanol modification-associated protein YfmH n=1 Tax=Oenococcus sp. TaxID=1979414 RepID=UPI0039E7C66D
MKIDEYSQFKQTVYSETLTDGLKVTLMPKKDFHSVFAALFVDAGAVDQKIINENGKVVTFPSGIAHFAEHKMFEKEQGDVDQIFSRYGAFSNAYTSQSRTVYYFQGTEEIAASIRLLLHFVQEPYYTQSSINKEQGIIGQELVMYQDMPDWALSFGLMGNLYAQQPLAQDIAGKVSTISQLTSDMLYQFHKYFYQPSNLHLKISGNIDPQATMALIRDTQRELSRPKIAFTSMSLFDNQIPILASGSRKMPISQTLITAGIKGINMPSSRDEAIDLAFASDLLLDLYFSDSSDWYMKNYDASILNDDFMAQAEIGRNYQFISFSGHGKQQKAFQEILSQLKRISFDSRLANEFEVQKSATFGELSMSLDQLENNVFTVLDEYDTDSNVFQITDNLKSLTYKRAVALFEKYYDINSFSRFSIEPLD